jgi:ABC-2 type transport system ATP-binding protein
MAQAKVGDKYRLYTGDPSALLPQVIDYTRAKGLRVISLNTLGPSLEDVFLEITGQQIGAVSQPTEPQTRRQRGG